jgi:hypothetical protein
VSPSLIVGQAVEFVDELVDLPVGGGALGLEAGRYEDLSPPESFGGWGDVPPGGRMALPHFGSLSLLKSSFPVFGS